MGEEIWEMFFPMVWANACVSVASVRKRQTC